MSLATGQMQPQGPVPAKSRDPESGYVARVASSPANSWFLFRSECQLTCATNWNGRLRSAKQKKNCGQQNKLSISYVSAFHIGSENFNVFGRFRTFLTVSSCKYGIHTFTNLLPCPKHLTGLSALGHSPHPSRSLKCAGREQKGQSWRPGKN